MRKAVRILLLILLLAVLVVAGASVYMLNYSLSPQVNKGRDTEGSYERLYRSYPHLQAWVDSLQHINALHHIYRYGADGLRLHALYVHAPDSTRRTAIIVHGYTDNAVHMLMIGYLYAHELGYNILLPDLHAHGESEGHDIRMGWKDRLEVLDWASKADSLFGGNTEMVVHGISMGAATTMMLSGELEHPVYGHLKCFVEDCGYTSVWDEFEYELQEIFGLPSFPLLYSTDLLCRLLYGWSFKQASSIEQVRKCSLPMLFIHGEADDYVPTRMVYPLYEAKPEPKALFTLPDVPHAVAYKTHPEAYTERVRSFVSKYIR